jgi:hypothetical protein
MKKILLIFFIVFSVFVLLGKIGILPSFIQLNLIQYPAYGNITDENSISGQVLIKETEIPVQSGYVKALKYDWAKDMILTIDSSSISIDGHYRLPKVPKDSLFIMAYGDDEYGDFVPGYHDTSVNWQTSLRVIPSSNIQNVNINVNRIIKQAENPYRVSGRVLKDPHIQNEFISDAVIYAKLGDDFKGYSISDQSGHYSIDSLPHGNIELVAVRIGYHSDYRLIQVGEYNIDTIDFYLSRVSSVNIPVEKIPVEYNLSQNSPNPFNPVTKIKFDLPKSSLTPNEAKSTFVKLIIYNVLGREVATLVNEHLQPGTYEVEWDGTDYPSGVYFYKLITGEVTFTRKMVLVK